MQTDRIGFSTWESSDLPLAEKLWGDPKVTRYICASGRFSEEEIRDRLQLEIRNGETHHMEYWPVFELSSGSFIGCCGLRPHREKEYEAGVHLLPEYRHLGYAGEAMSAVAHYAFSVLGADKLFAGHHPENTASRKMLLRSGFTYIGDEFYAPTGLDHPSYELPNPQYPKCK